MYKTSYLKVLKSYKTRLDDLQGKLFVSKDTDVVVPFRDLIDSGPGGLLS